ncbi:hypothetical protein [Streptobacillus moniliformis]|uniref:hypothetical protein n=1 Tax=Streptobacillus moniliformis TaxID=34105 RepID=UPI0007E34F80|nr:hypothetical protein [Streptobacillus moniliformis]
MKKLILSLLLIIGLFSFSSKIPKVNKKYEVKNTKSNSYKKTKIKEMEKNIEIENVLEVNKTINVEKVEPILKPSKKRKLNISGPRYRIDGNISTLPIYDTKIKKIGYYAYKSLSFLPEWKVQVSPLFDITFGPKISANLLYGLNGDNTVAKTESDKSIIIMSASLGTEVDFNYRLRDNLKMYAGIETQIGLGEKINTKSGTYYNGHIGKDNEIESYLPYTNSKIFTSLKIIYVAKVAIGFKVNDKYNVAFFGGYGKGNFGIEFGHTF